MESNYDKSFGLILNAGNSKSKSLMAIEAAREFNFDEAENLIKDAKEDLKLAHKMQTNMIQAQAKGEQQDVNVILVHAQDHLTMATIMIDQGYEFINIYKILDNLLKKEN
ncbi:TPA: PTS lactose/cellobiose transporter subunit IIA [Listeria monocytogenes]